MTGAAVKIKEGFVVGEAEVYAEICQEEESRSSPGTTIPIPK